jgi:hypothetical protein
MSTETLSTETLTNNSGAWRRFVAGLPMRTALFAVAVVWLLGCVWSYQEQSAFAADKGFGFPHLLPLVIDGFAVSMAGVAWAASLDARPAVAARLATLVAVGASAGSNGAWAWLRTERDLAAVLLAVAVPVAANLAFEVLLAELRRQVQRRRGLPAPVALPSLRVIRVVLAPGQTFRAWRSLVLELTALPPGPDSDGPDPDGPDPAGSPAAGELTERARQLVATAERPVGRRTLARELDITEYQARQLLPRINGGPQEPPPNDDPAGPAAITNGVRHD